MNTPRLANKKDMPKVLELIKALALFEKEPDAVTLTLDTLIEDGFGLHPKFTCFVVEGDDGILGTALVYPRYSTWKGPVLHLEDLIVHEDYRGQGYGSALLDAVVQYGKSMKVKRISWEVLHWNTPAIAFYESKGARILEDWDVVQLDEEGINNYIARL